jgi:hypothetical protein
MGGTTAQSPFSLATLSGQRALQRRGSANEITGRFGGADQRRSPVNRLPSLLYAA